MPRSPTVDASAGLRSAERRLVGLEHLVLTLVLIALYTVAMSVALDDGALRACAGSSAGSSAGVSGTSCAGHGAP